MVITPKNRVCHNINNVSTFAAENVCDFSHARQSKQASLFSPNRKVAPEWVVSHIELLLNYCLRFYDRQFITREERIGDVWCSGIRMHAGKEIVDAEVGYQYSEEREEHKEMVSCWQP